MNKNTKKQTTGGCKAAKELTWKDYTAKSTPNEVRQMVANTRKRIKEQTKIITLAELREIREQMEKQAREHALQAALAHYFKGCHGIEPEADLIKSLQHLVFTNWLQAHAFNHEFEGLYALN